jgi:hypothetical protein
METSWAWPPLSYQIKDLRIEEPSREDDSQHPWIGKVPWSDKKSCSLFLPLLMHIRGPQTLVFGVHWARKVVFFSCPELLFRWLLEHCPLTLCVKHRSGEDSGPLLEVFVSYSTFHLLGLENIPDREVKFYIHLFKYHSVILRPVF